MAFLFPNHEATEMILRKAWFEQDSLVNLGIPCPGMGVASGR